MYVIVYLKSVYKDCAHNGSVGVETSWNIMSLIGLVAECQQNFIQRRRSLVASIVGTRKTRKLNRSHAVPAHSTLSLSFQSP